MRSRGLKVFSSTWLDRTAVSSSSSSEKSGTLLRSSGLQVIVVSSPINVVYMDLTSFSRRIVTGCGGAPKPGKIHSKPELAAYPGARGVLTANQTECNAEVFADRILASAKELQLRPTQTVGIGLRGEQLTAQGQPGIKVVQQRAAEDVDLAARRLNAYHACARIAG